MTSYRSSLGFLRQDSTPARDKYLKELKNLGDRPLHLLFCNLNSRLRSPYAFLMVMEFINEEPEDFADIMILLKPAGSAFHKKYVLGSAQFIPHNRKFAYQESEKFA